MCVCVSVCSLSAAPRFPASYFLPSEQAWTTHPTFANAPCKGTGKWMSHRPEKDQDNHDAWLPKDNSVQTAGEEHISPLTAAWLIFCVCVWSCRSPCEKFLKITWNFSFLTNLSVRVRLQWTLSQALIHHVDVMNQWSLFVHFNSTGVQSANQKTSLRWFMVYLLCPLHYSEMSL